MSCQENCEAISELSSVQSVTFGVAGSWCLPGALDPYWDLSAKPGEMPRLLSLSFTHCLARLSSGLPLSLLPHTVSLYSVSPFKNILTYYHAFCLCIYFLDMQNHKGENPKQNALQSQMR